MAAENYDLQRLQITMLGRSQKSLDTETVLPLIWALERN